MSERREWMRAVGWGLACWVSVWVGSGSEIALRAKPSPKGASQPQLLQRGYRGVSTHGRAQSCITRLLMSHKYCCSYSESSGFGDGLLSRVAVVRRVRPDPVRDATRRGPHPMTPHASKYALPTHKPNLNQSRHYKLKPTMSLLVDKHRPRQLSDLSYHQELSDRLAALVSPRSSPPAAFPTGSISCPTSDRALTDAGYLAGSN